MIAVWSRTEEWGSWRAVWTVALEHGDGLLEASTVHTLDDYWSYEIGADLPYGPRSGPLGALGDARRLRIGLRRSW